MWKNYLKIGFRSLVKNRTYAFINIFGLSVGLAACLMLLLYVAYERNYDDWLPNSENAYQFQTYYLNPESGEGMDLQMSAYVTKGALQKDFPQIEHAVYALSSPPVLLRNGEAQATVDFRFVDGDLFDILQVPFLRGDRATALDQVGSIALSRSEAERLFGSANPIGETLTLVSTGRETDYRVTGVYEDLPANSHFAAKMVARFDPATYFADTPDFLTAWGWQSGWVYVALRPGTDVNEINSQLQAWERRNIPDENSAGRRVNQGDNADYGLVNIRDVHLGRAQVGAMTPGNDPRTIVTFAIIAFLILGMALVNFTNLATARAGQRAREVALRKVLGASRRQLIVQFLAESVLIVAISMLVALAMVELFLPILSGFLEADLRMSYWGPDGMLLPIVLLTLVVGALGGFYPAFYLSRFQPAQVLKANKSSAEASGSGRLRNALVIGQFAVSIGLIICTAIVYAQTAYARSVDPGFRREGLIQLENVGRREVFPVIETLRREILAVNGVTGAGTTDIGVATNSNSETSFYRNGGDAGTDLDVYDVGPGFFETMEIELIAGRLFDENRPADDSTRPFPEDPAAERALVARGKNVVINALAARRLGFESPAAAVGQRMNQSWNDDYGGILPVTIIGVVEDSRFRSIRQPIDPIVYSFDRTGQDWMVVRYDSEDPGAVRDAIADVWKRVVPSVPFEARFSEEIVGEAYRAEDARAKTFAGFALLAIVIACLGLFGLAAFTAERRTKEIGIRKVLGARTRDIVKLLAWQFSKPVIIANLIAWPIAWWAMRDWLNTFDARIDLGPTPFVLAGLIALVIAVGTIAGHAIRVARSNPIHALRYE